MTDGITTLSVCEVRMFGKKRERKSYNFCTFKVAKRNGTHILVVRCRRPRHFSFHFIMKIAFALLHARAGWVYEKSDIMRYFLLLLHEKIFTFSCTFYDIKVSLNYIFVSSVLLSRFIQELPCAARAILRAKQENNYVKLQATREHRARAMRCDGRRKEKKKKKVVGKSFFCIKSKLSRRNEGRAHRA